MSDFKESIDLKAGWKPSKESDAWQEGQTVQMPQQGCELILCNTRVS